MCKALITFLLIITFTSSVCAASIDRAQITYKGTEGIFFSEEIATKLLSDIEELHVQRNTLKLLDTKLELKDEKIAALELEIMIVDDIAAKYKANYQLEHDTRIKDQAHYEALLKQKNAWYKRPGLWFGIGFVVASACAIGLSFSLQSVRE